MGTVAGFIGNKLARYLAQPSHHHGTGPATDQTHLLACVQLADVILVEGTSRFSTAIKYLTQSTWSHAALYVGMRVLRLGEAPEPCFLEADVVAGVRLVGVEEFAGYHVRICRAAGLDEAERALVVAFALSRLGAQYDLRNVIDLARYLLPTPPVPIHFRRRMIAVSFP